MNDIQFRAHAIAMEWLRDHKELPLRNSRIDIPTGVDRYVEVYVSAYEKALKKLKQYPTL